MRMVLEDMKRRYFSVLNIDYIVPSRKADRLTNIKYEKARKALAQKNLSSPRRKYWIVLWEMSRMSCRIIIFSAAVSRI